MTVKGTFKAGGTWAQFREESQGSVGLQRQGDRMVYPKGGKLNTATG